MGDEVIPRAPGSPTEAWRGHRWTTAELSDLMQRWARGDSPADIASHFGLSERSVNRLVGRLRRAGVPLAHRRRGHKAGMRNRSWTQSDVEYVLRRRSDGASCEEIAGEIGRTYCGVNYIVQRLRLGENVPIKRLAPGKTRLWDAEVLKAQIEAQENYDARK